MTIKQITFGFIIFFVAATLTVLGAHYFMNQGYLNKKRYHDTILAENLNCSQEWLEIGVEGRVKIERDRQMIGITFATPFTIDLDDYGGIRLPDGRAFDPEIHLIDANNTIHTISYSGARGKKIATYRPETTLPPGVSYEKLRIKCDSPIAIERILWTTYNIKDMH